MAESPWTMFEIAAGTGMLGHGVSIALETLGIRTDVVGGCEWESCAASAFMAGVEIETGRRPAVWDDARTFVGRRYRCTGTGSGVDIIAAGYPCQPFSSAGKRGGGKDARHLWPACRRIVARLKPSIVCFENVDGHVSMGLWKVVRDCERLGYRTTAGVYSSEEVGAPHLRKRVFILGVADANSGEHSTERWKGAAFERPSQAMGDTTHADWRDRAEDEQGEAECRRDRHTDAGDELVDGIGPRPQWQSDADAPQRREAAHGRSVGSCRPIFPPGRDDYRRWAELAHAGLDPTLMPSIESGVSVVADGMASSSDLLRLGGNGVNPLCAAWAFLNLAACLLDGVEE